MAPLKIQIVIDKAMAEAIDDRNKLIEEMLALLKEVKSVERGDGARKDDFCPSCLGLLASYGFEESTGHLDDCKIIALIAKAEEMLA